MSDHVCVCAIFHLKFDDLFSLVSGIIAHVVSLDKKLCSTLSLSTQVFKCALGSPALLSMRRILFSANWLCLKDRELEFMCWNWPEILTSGSWHFGMTMV